MMSVLGQVAMFFTILASASVTNFLGEFITGTALLDNSFILALSFGAMIGYVFQPLLDESLKVNN